jgi:hypothetical protein
MQIIILIESVSTTQLTSTTYVNAAVTVTTELGKEMGKLIMTYLMTPR